MGKKVFKGIRFVFRILGYATLFSFLGLLLAFLSIELFLRIFYNPYNNGEYATPKLGWQTKPHVSFVEPRYGMTISFNSYGFRDKEYSLRKPSGIFRIVVLGDSFTEGRQVPVEKTFPKVLEEKLHKIDKKIDVLAFGRAGYGTLQEYLVFRHLALKFHPDLVVLSFFLNDFTDNYPLTNSTNLGPTFDIAYTPELKTIPEYQKWSPSFFTRFLYGDYTLFWTKIWSFFEKNFSPPKGVRDEKFFQKKRG